MILEGQQKWPSGSLEVGNIEEAKLRRKTKGVSYIERTVKKTTKCSTPTPTQMHNLEVNASIMPGTPIPTARFSITSTKEFGCVKMQQESARERGMLLLVSAAGQAKKHWHLKSHSEALLLSTRTPNNLRCKPSSLPYLWQMEDTIKISKVTLDPFHLTFNMSFYRSLVTEPLKWKHSNCPFSVRFSFQRFIN